MKKIALTALLAVFAVSGAHAANVLDGNPLYMPKAGHFYSETALSSHSETTKDWTLGEEFGFGITNKFMLEISTEIFERAETKEYYGPNAGDEMFNQYGLGNVALKATFRALDMGAWKLDAYGEYKAGSHDGGYGLAVHSEAYGDDLWFDEEITGYKWTAGVRAGFATPVFTVAGHLEFVYGNSESFNWDDEGAHAWKLGVDGQYVINRYFNLVAGVEYAARTDDYNYDAVGGKLGKVKNAGTWTGELGVNYNIDATKYIGAYVNAAMDHWKGDVTEGEKGWGFKDGFGFGVKFGIDF